jgi:hypothetical protein
MKKLVLCFAAIMAVSGIAAANGLCVNTAIDVTVTPGGSFACGTLVFSDFYLTDLTGNSSGMLDINSVSISNQGVVTLQENPNLETGGSEDLWFTVSGTLNSISLAPGGTSATVTERACSNSIATFGDTADLCSNTGQSAFVAPLGQLTVQSGDPLQQIAPGIYTSGPVHIMESINAGEGSGLSDIYQGFGDPPSVPSVPEPITLVLLGSALAFLGIAGRRLRKN